MKRLMAFLWLVMGVSSTLASAAEPLSIRDLLLGNSITNPRFGCIYYRDEKTAKYFLNGQDYSYNWSVVNGRYLSNSRCGADGCKISKIGDQVTFSSPKTNYFITAKLHKGNACSDAVISSFDHLHSPHSYSQTQ